MPDGDQQRWLTCAEAGELLGISTQAIELLREQLGIANRRCDRAEQEAATLRAELVNLRMSKQAADLAEYGTAQAVDLRKRLDAAEQRADRAEKRADDELGRADRERERADSAAQQLAAVEAELVGAHVEAAGLRCKLAAAARPAAPPPRTELPSTRWRRVLRLLGHTR